MSKTQFIPEMLFSSAQGFCQIGRQYADAISEDNFLIQKMVPAMMNFAFGIELLLKGLQYTSNGTQQKGHSMYKLFNNIAKLDRQVIEKTFNDLRVGIAEKDRLPAFTYSITRGDNPKDKTETSEDLNTFLKLHDLSFEAWRYFFEFGESNKHLYANFHLLDCFARSLMALLSVKGIKPTIATNMPKIY